MAAPCRLLLLALAACLGVALAVPVRNVADCVNNALLSVAGNVYPTTHQITRPVIQETTVTTAQNFEISYQDTFKIVNVTKGTTSETYVLYQCGTTAPKLADLGLPTGTKVFSVPLMSVNAADSTVLHFLKLLGVQDRVSYVTPYAVDPCMQLLSSEWCGNRSSNSVAAGAVDGTFDFGKDANDPTSIMFAATADFGPLHGAEYLKYAAAFFNREAAANTIFDKIFSAYTSLSASVMRYINDNTVVPPVVAWVYYQAAYPPDKEQIQIKFHSYRKQYTLDAGGQCLDLSELKKKYVNGANVQVNKDDQLVLFDVDSANTTTVLREILKTVDILIDESYVPGNVTKYTVASFLERYRLAPSAAATDFKFIQNQQLLRLDGTASAMGTIASMESGLARPDVMLHDLVYFINPGVLRARGDTTSPTLVRSLFPKSTSSTPLPLTFTAMSSATILTAENCVSRTCGTAAQPICPAVYLDCNGKLVTATDTNPCPPSNCNLNGNNNNQSPPAGGAASKAMASPVLVAVMSLLAVVMVAVGGPSWSLA